MDSDIKRFTISIPQNLQIELDEVKKAVYYKNSQNEMIRDLIMRGLNDIKTEKNLGKCPKKAGSKTV